MIDDFFFVVPWKPSNMQFETYSVLTALLSIFFLTATTVGATMAMVTPKEMMLELHNQGTASFRVSDGTLLSSMIFDTFTRTFAMTVLLGILVQMFRYAMNKTPRLMFINVCLVATAVFATINMFLLYYVNFVEMNTSYTHNMFGMDDHHRLNRICSIVGISMVAILFWVVIPLYILTEFFEVDVKVVDGHVIVSHA